MLTTQMWFQVRKSGSLASTISNFSTSLITPTSPDLGSQSIPEVMAQTPQGTVIDWEELFDVRQICYLTFVKLTFNMRPCLWQCLMLTSCIASCLYFQIYKISDGNKSGKNRFFSRSTSPLKFFCITGFCLA